MMEANLPTLPILTIAIPTWNRSEYLRQNLSQLRAEIDTVGHHLIEVLISDNCSTDSTYDVVKEAQLLGLNARYVRNQKNLGWALNFAQCVDLASGKYMLLFGDDDVLCPGALSLLISHLTNTNHGVVCMRPYGYDFDPVSEYPGGGGRAVAFYDASTYLIEISKYFTLTSALVINRTLLKEVDSRQFIHTDLATFHLVLRAALSAQSNVYINQYLVASKRQNSASYAFYKVFINEFWEIIDAHKVHGFNPVAIRRLERKRLFSYYPFYMLDIRVSCVNTRETAHALRIRFGSRFLYWIWIAPILYFPRPVALLWGFISMSVGRVFNGDFRRGLMFVRNRFLGQLRHLNFLIISWLPKKGGEG